MWYLISFGGGFVIGLIFLIWALGERSARQKAEREMDEAIARAEAAERIAKNNAAVANDLKAETIRYEERAAVLRQALEEAQQKLLQCNDPEAIRKWLESELKKETV